MEPVMRSTTRRARLPLRGWIGLIVICSVLPFHALARGLELADPASVGLSTERLERLTGFLRRDIAEGRIPGAVMLVARHGKIAYLQALGMRDTLPSLK